MRRILATASTCHLAGYALGTFACHLAWRAVAGEHHYRLGRR